MLSSVVIKNALILNTIHNIFNVRGTVIILLQLHRWCKVSVLASSAVDGFKVGSKSKAIKLVCVASPLSTQH